MQMLETIFIKTAIGDNNIGIKNKDAKETLYQSLPLVHFLKFEEEKGEFANVSACIIRNEACFTSN